MHRLCIVGDKRKLERFTLHVPARVLFRKAEGSQEAFEATTRDISAEGAYFHASHHELPVGAQVEVELVLTFERLRELLNATDQVTARVDGKVLREEPDGVVVVFNHPFRFFPGPGGGHPLEPDLQPA